jgi:ABC-type glutathione transport system ATPase component
LAFLTDLADGRRGAMKGKIESVVTEALRMIYGNSYRVELNYAFKNNRSSLEIEMVRETHIGDVRRDMSGFGGGVADTISVPLRLMVLCGSKQTDKVVILDECWKHIDPGRIELVGKFLRALSEQLGLQVLFATHHLPLQQFADRVYNTSEKDGKSNVKAT